MKKFNVNQNKAESAAESGMNNSNSLDLKNFNTVEDFQLFINSHNELKNISELKRKFSSVYNKIRKNKLLGKIHFPKPESWVDKYNTLDEFQDFINIKKIKSSQELRKQYKEMYNKAKRLNYLKELNFEVKQVKKKHIEYNIVEVELNLENYNTLEDFQNLIDYYKLKRPEEFKLLNVKLYNKAIKKGFNSKTLMYISYPNRYNVLGDFQKLIDEDENIKTPLDFKTNYPGVYKKASKLNILNKLIYTNRKNFSGLDYTNYNTVDEIQDFIDKHKVLSSFHLRRDFPGLYNKLIRIKSTKEVIYFGGTSSKISGLQVILENILRNLNIKFESEKSFDWLIDNKNGFLRLDIFIPELNLAIEGQGEQHFIPIDHFGGIEGYKERYNNDKRKYDLCIDHGINIIYFTTKEQLRNKNKICLEDYFAPIITTQEDLIFKIQEYISSKK